MNPARATEIDITSELAQLERSNVRALFSAERFGADRRRGMFELALPGGWRTSIANPWVHYEPAELDLPEQGWKIHISTVEMISMQVLSIVAEICFASGTAFKHLASAGELRAANSKYTDRGAAGKFVTIYPTTVEEFNALLSALDRQLSGLPGPYILSDVRFGDGPVYVRYGAFREMRSVSDSGDEILCIRRPDGELVEDRRAPELHVPDFAPIPESISRIVSERLNPSGSELNDLLGDLNPEGALHFSNAGGVYLLRASSDATQYVMKEGRKYAAWDPRGVDAFDRTLAEYSNLKMLEPTGVAPKPIALRIVENHAFLIEEHIEGRNLHSWMASEYPFSYQYSLDDYEKKAMKVLGSLGAAVEAVHQRGFAVMDLQPFNVIVTPGETVRLIDFESCCSLRVSDASAIVGTPGYIPKVSHSALARDSYAMLQLAIGLFYPLAPVAAISDDEIPNLMRMIGSLFSADTTALIDDLFASANSVITPGLAIGRPMRGTPGTKLVRLIEDLTDGIHQLRDGDEVLRTLYPLSDAMPGSMGELSIESGLSGIMLALGPGDPFADADLAVLKKAATRTPIAAPGLMSGATGVSAMLATRGEPAAARELYGRRHRLPRGSKNISLRNGVSGELVGALALARSTRDSSIAVEAHEWVGVLLGMINDPPDRLEQAGSSTAKALGLVHGWSGAAVALCMAAREFDNDKLFEAARIAIELDMANMVTAPDGSLQADDGFRMMPYVADGSAGLGIALTAIPRDYRRDGDDDILRRIATACRVRACVSAGLLHGRAGLVLTLSVLGSDLGDSSEVLLGEQLPLLRPFLVAGVDHSLFIPANDNRRLCLDFSQGTAGLLLGLKAIERGVAGRPHFESMFGLVGDLSSDESYDRVRATS